MIAHYYERLVAAAAVLLLLAAGAWFLLQRGTIQAIQERTVAVTLSDTNYDTQEIALPTTEAQTWTDPTGAAEQPEWVFDVFTPPVIYYNRLTKAFTVTPPDYSQPKEDEQETVVVEPPFGVELVDVELEPFRLQLVGYAGGEGNYLGMFENAVSGDSLLGRAGRTVTELGLTIVTLEVRKERIELPDSMPIVQTVAYAVVRDEATGEEFDLNSLKRRATGSPSVVLRIPATGEQRTEKENAEFKVGSVTYRVGMLDPTAGTASVTRIESTADGEVVTTKVLQAGTSAPAADTEPAEQSESPTETAPLFPNF